MTVVQNRVSVCINVDPAGFRNVKEQKRLRIRNKDPNRLTWFDFDLDFLVGGFGSVSGLSIEIGGNTVRDVGSRLKIRVTAYA